MKLLLAAAIALSLQVEPRAAKAVVDGDALLFSFELSASGAPQAVRSVDFTVFVEEAPLFSGSVPGFAMVAGFGDARRSREAILRITGKAKFEYRVRGIVHAVSADGSALDIPFSAKGLCPTPDELAQPRTAVSHSLLSY
jgi:hypothetical protein